MATDDDDDPVKKALEEYAKAAKLAADDAEVKKEEERVAKEQRDKDLKAATAAAVAHEAKVKAFFDDAKTAATKGFLKIELAMTTIGKPIHLPTNKSLSVTTPQGALQVTPLASVTFPSVSGRGFAAVHLCKYIAKGEHLALMATSKSTGKEGKDGLSVVGQWAFGSNLTESIIGEIIAQVIRDASDRNG